MSASHDKETSKTLESGGNAPMPVPPTSSEHESAKSDDKHPGDHDPEYKPHAGSTKPSSDGKAEKSEIVTK